MRPPGELPKIGLTYPFRGSEAISQGLLTKHQLTCFTRLFHDIYLHPEAKAHFLAKAQGAHLLHPEGVLGFQTMLELYGKRLFEELHEPVHLILPRSSWQKPQEGLRVHRFDIASDEVVTRYGLPVTSPARTGFDLARSLRLIDAVMMLDVLLHRRLTTPEELAAYARRGGRGSTGVGRALDLADGRSESPMESRTRLLLVLSGLPAPEPQFEVYDNKRFIARLDLAYPKQKLGIEYDGAHHRERITFQRDAKRANALAAAGWTILRFTYDDMSQPGRIIATVRADLASYQTVGPETHS
jgi:hypothetical protein